MIAVPINFEFEFVLGDLPMPRMARSSLYRMVLLSDFRVVLEGRVSCWGSFR